MSKRTSMLEAITQGGSTDPFAWYGLAMEYKNAGRLEEALGTFERLRELDPSYLAAYLMAGQTAVGLGQLDRAVTWFEQGLSLAQERGDHKTHGELQAALDEAGEAQ